MPTLLLPIHEFQGPYRFLSNFWPALVSHDAILYPSVEHAYQAAKLTDPAARLRLTRLPAGAPATRVPFDGQLYPSQTHVSMAAQTLDPALRALIAQCPLPGTVKRAVRTCPMRPDWAQAKLAVMRDLVYQKFAHTPHLSAQLLATGDAELIEGNPWGDTFWGVCRGQGQNWLGHILMETRYALRTGSSTKG